MSTGNRTTDYRNREVFTPGAIARICRVSPPQVCKWIDSGLLRGYYLPMSRDRRVLRSKLLEFMAEHGLPTDLIEDSTQ